MNVDGFTQDLSRKADLLTQLRDTGFDWSDVAHRPIVFLGMGSSHFAASTISHLLNRVIPHSSAVLASTSALPAFAQDSAVIAISATGKSVETLSSFEKVPSGVTRIALTNDVDSPISRITDKVIDMKVGVEKGEVASLSYLATLVALLRLAQKRKAIELNSNVFDKASEALHHIHDTRFEWLPKLTQALIGNDGTYFSAPLERLCSAQQSALMLRECPRLSAVATEVGDWSHIDVYLTKTKDYRLALFPGSPWQSQLLEWTTKRNSTVVCIGHEHPRAQLNLRYPHDDDELVRLLVEPSFAELLSADLWALQK